MESRIAALLTCHNRRDKTVACLRTLVAQRLPAGVTVTVFLVDDGCTDGTADAVRKACPSVNILQGDGSLYWNGGMRVAFGEAMRQGFDYYLWLNDDTYLYPDALQKLLATNASIGPRETDHAIVAGSTRDPETGKLTYGGLVRSSWWHPLKLGLVPPGDALKRCLTIHGNCVLIPAAVAQVLGNLSVEYRHSLGDNDYGLRAGRMGFSCWIAPQFIGTCANDHPPRSRYRGLSARAKWEKIVGPTGHPPKPWAEYCKRYAGPLWFLFWCRPYLKDLVVMFAPGGALVAKSAA